MNIGTPAHEDVLLIDSIPHGPALKFDSKPMLSSNAKYTACHERMPHPAKPAVPVLIQGGRLIA